MPNMLSNVKVTKVSFVTRGANGKKFFLAKSADDTSAAGDHASNNTNNNPLSGGTNVRKEVKTQLAAILKKERDAAKVVSLLKGVDGLKPTDDELTEVSEFIGLLAQPLAPPLAAAGAEADTKANANAELTKQFENVSRENAALAVQLEQLRAERHEELLRKWLSTECPYLNIAADDAVKAITSIEKVNKDAAETLKKSYKAVSDSLKASTLFSEVGRGGADADPLSGGLVAEVRKGVSEAVAKSSGVKQVQTVIDVIKSFGAQRYNDYRAQFINRAEPRGAAQMQE